MIGVARSTLCYELQPPQKDAPVMAAMRQLSAQCPRFGYRRIHDVLRPAYPEINHKRIYRLYSEAGLAVRRRRNVKRPSNERQPLLPASAINEVWSMDFVRKA
jgi:putative transposase